MMVSGNDAAVALAEYISGSIENFSNLMNDKALSLGLSSTNFTSPHGLDHDEHYTTAYDLALITDYALSNKTFSKIVNTQSYMVNINGNLKQLNNTNELLGYLEGVYGVKTGFTNGANRCLVTACKRKDLDIICVVLGCDTKKDRTKDSINLINYIFNNYSLIGIKNIIETKVDEWNLNNNNYFTINKGISQNLEIKTNESQIPYEYIAINNSNIEKVAISIKVNPYIDAPVSSGCTVGKVEIAIPQSSSFSVDLVSFNSISRKNIYYYMNMFLKDYFSLLTFWYFFVNIEKYLLHKLFALNY